MMKAMEECTIQAALTGDYGMALEAFVLNPLVENNKDTQRVLDELLVAHENICRSSQKNTGAESSWCSYRRPCSRRFDETWKVKKMSVKIEKFGELPDGRTASLYHLKNHRGFEVCVTDFGVNIQSILVRNCRGEKTDVALGFDHLEDYLENNGMFGATVGRNVNRISNAEFQIDGIKYHLAKTEENTISTVIKNTDFIKYCGTQK